MGVRRWLLIGLGVAALSYVSPTFAQVDDRSRNAARRLGEEGVQFYEQGRYAEAADRLVRAYKVLEAPSLGLWSARAFEKNGQLVEAMERYHDVLRYAVKPDDPPIFTKSQDEARTELAALEPRVPSVTIVVEGAAANSATVTLDGEPLPSSLVGVPIGANPGQHVLKAVAGSTEATSSVELRESESKSVSLVLTATAAPAAAPASAEPATSSAAAPEGDAESTGSSKTLAWVLVGVGGAAFVTGGVFGIMSLSKQGELSDSCPNDQCPPEFHDDVDTLGTFRVVSLVGLGLGAVGVGVGAALLLSGDSEGGASVSAYLTPASAGLRGQF